MKEKGKKKLDKTLKGAVCAVDLFCGVGGLTHGFPISLSCLEAIGKEYQLFRERTMNANNEGITKTYNRFHNPDEIAEDIQKLRELHIQIDKAVAAAYGWNDLDLGHGFHETKQGLQFTISEEARREVLQRLLKLNHERYAEEVAKGLHDKGAKKKTTKKKAKKEEKILF